jgi:hypothetical protein
MVLPAGLIAFQYSSSITDSLNDRLSLLFLSNAIILATNSNYLATLVRIEPDISSDSSHISMKPNVFSSNYTVRPLPC